MYRKLLNHLFHAFGNLIKRNVHFVTYQKIRLITSRIKLNKYYDILTFEIMRQVFTNESVSVDIGAHKGGILQRMMEFSPNGEFYAFEPLDEAFSVLENKFKNKNNVHLFKLALSNSCGESKYFKVNNYPAYSGLLKRSYPKDDTELDISEIKVRTEKLDNLLDPDKKIDFIKIDVEGGEFNVLLGSGRVFKKFKPVTVFEFEKGAASYYQVTPKKLYKLLVDEYNMKVSTLEKWLINKCSINLDEFEKIYLKGKNIYFVAFW